MLDPGSPPPRMIDVFINSGQANEWKTSATVLDVDQKLNLAVLGTGAPQNLIPEPLTVKSAGGLHQLDEIYVFGFPFGTQLGKEICIRPSSVSALRKKDSVLDRVQLNGGVDPGNAGGPVVDSYALSSG